MGWDERGCSSDVRREASKCPVSNSGYALDVRMSESGDLS